MIVLVREAISSQLPDPGTPDPDKIRELARRGEAWGNSESRQMLERAIETGRRGVPEAYA